LRLCVGRWRINGRLLTHVAAWAVPHSPWHAFQNSDALWDAVVQTWQAIAQSGRTPTHYEVGAEGALHFFIEEVMQ
jgi:hypothetical protein